MRIDSIVQPDSLCWPLPICFEPFVQVLETGKKWSVYLLNHHTDLISNLGVLAATTCFLASKVFVNAPAFLPRVAIIILNRGVIIWLNEQVRDCMKTWQDFRLLGGANFSDCVVTAGKVFQKFIDTLLTCGMFTASCAIFFGFPELTIPMYAFMRPFALSSLAVGIGSKIYDYVVNKALIKKLNEIDCPEDIQQASYKIARLMKCFLEVVQLSVAEQRVLEAAKDEESFTEERVLARRLVRQLDMWTLQVFRESLKGKKIDNVRMEAIKLFYSVKDSMANGLASVEANLSLMTLGYAAMTVTRAWPDTVQDMTARWIMSVLYTDELVRQKFFQWDLSKTLTKPQSP